MIFSVGRRSFFIATIALWFATTLSAQNDGGWKNASGDRYGGGAESTTNSPFAATAGNQVAPAAAPRGAGDITPIGGGLAPVGAGPTRATVTKGSGALPNDQGQVWREYEIRPYTHPRQHHRPTRAGDRRLDPPRNRLRSVALRSGRPAQRQPRSAPRLSHARDASHRGRHRRPLRQLVGQRLRVHAPRRHGWQSELAGQGAADDDADPRPVARRAGLAHGQGKRPAALVSELSRRTDYREYNSSQQLVNNGQSIVISTMRPRIVRPRRARSRKLTWPGYQPEMGTIEEGFSLEFSPLLAHGSGHRPTPW